MTNDLSVLLRGGVIVPYHEVATRQQAILALCEALSGVLGMPAPDIEAAVMERERLGSTGVGEGVAIPHARLDGLAAPVGGFMRLARGVDFEAVDGRPCDLVFMLLAPDGSGAEHLRALAQVSRVFRQSAVRDGLRAARNEADVRAVICGEAVSG